MDNKKDSKAEERSALGFHRAVPIILFAFAVFIGICFIPMGDTGMLGSVISGVLLGLFSIGAYFIPVILAVHAIFYISDIGEKRLLSRLIFSILTVVAISVMTHAVTNWSNDALTFDIVAFYTEGGANVGGGVIGGTLAFVLMSLLGNWGVIILTSVMLLIYIVFFFSKGSTLLELGRTVLLAVLGFLAFFEKGFKKIVAFFKKSKTEKEIESAKEKSEALADDDFFDLDNGMASIEVSELGILESRSRESMEQNPTLHETVHHKSEVGDEDKPRDTRRTDKVYMGDIDGYTDNEHDDTRASDIIIDVEENVSTAHSVESDSADSVFTHTFDPYSLAVNEELANKPSSRALDYRTEKSTPTSVTEDLEDISEEEYKKMQRNAEFEKRKQFVVDERRNADAVRDIQKTVEIHIQESEEISAPEVDSTVSVTIEKDKNETFKRAVYDIKPESDVLDDVYAPIGRQDGFKPFDIPRDEVGLEFEFGGESEPEKLTVERTMLTEEQSFEPVVEPEATEPEAVPVSESFDNEKDTFSLVGIDDEDEDDGEGEPEEFVEAEEIPPEEQNPFIMEARGMFDMFREENDNALENEDSTENLEPIVIDEDIDINEDIDVQDDEDYSDAEDDEDENEEDEDDDIPFDYIRPSTQKPAPDVKPQAKVEKIITPPKKEDWSNYKFPPIDFLAPGEVDDDESIKDEIFQKSNIILNKLAEFGVTATIKGVDRGPRITRYEVVPATGIKVSQVTGLYNDIKLALATGGVRMLAPVPGKSAVGFEVPNKKAVTVRLRELLEHDSYKSSTSTTFVCMGKDVSGNAVFADIEKFPHAVVAGATGTGKSVCINSLLISILYRARPDEVKLILIDPKKVEFNMYNGIPHLLIPVVTEAKQAAGALMWACNEMERRYSLIQALNVRNIQAYNDKVRKDPSLGEFLPKIIIVIDELSNLMLEVKDPVETLIDRIAAMARAAGIHLLLGTQRPDTNVISGKIKNNINVRISCKVTSLADSRTVLDMAGAEKLLGKGDMLFKTENDPEPVRLQSCFVSDSEVQDVMDYLKGYSNGAQYNEEVLDEINRAAKKCGNQKKGGPDDEDDEDDVGSIYGDPEFRDAVEYCIRAGQASASNLQIRMKIGFQRASRYINQMEMIGVVGEKKGSKPREIMLTIDEWHEKLYRMDID